MLKYMRKLLPSQPLVVTGQKRQRSTDNLPTTDRGGFDGGKAETVNQLKNPKIQNLLDEIVNDGTLKKTHTEKAAPLEKTLKGPARPDFFLFLLSNTK